MKTWFPTKANEFLETVHKKLFDSQATPEIIHAFESKQRISEILSKSIDSNTVLDNFGISFALLTFIVAAMITLFVIMRKCFGPKKTT